MAENRHFLSDPRTWVDLYGDFLVNYAYSRLRDQIAAEDVTQETFLAALKARDRFTGSSSEKTWLTGILKHKIIDHIRRRAREVAVDDVEQLPVERHSPYTAGEGHGGHWKPGAGPRAWPDDPAMSLENKEFWEYLNLCLDSLPPRMAVLFTLYEMEELPGPEICKVMEISSTNLWVMLHRVRRQLRSCLEQNWLGGLPGEGRRS